MDKKQFKKVIANEQKELVHMLNEWDPISVLPGKGGPLNEYDSFVGPILSLLHRGENKEKLIAFLNEHLEIYIGLKPEYSKPTEFAEKIMNWWNKKISKDHVKGNIQN